MKRINRRYQKLLKDLGLYDGEIDGIYGPKTKEAVIKFQRMNGLVVDGIIGPQTRSEFEKHIRYDPRTSVHYGENDIKCDFSKYNFKRWPRENTRSLMNFYGNPGENLVRMEFPYPMRLAWDPDTIIKSNYVHEKVADSLYKVLSEIKEIYTENEIKKHGFDLFGGLYNKRKIRGGKRWSTHAWGIAIDLNPGRNGLKTRWKDAYFSRPECQGFVEAFLKEGWYSLGLCRNYDSMHFQACWRG